MDNEFPERIARFLNDYGIHDFTFRRRAKHRSVVINHCGRTHVHVFPSTPSDCRSLLNTLSDLRHELGLLNKAKDPARAPARAHVHKAPRPKAALEKWPSPTPAAERACLEDKFFARLAALKARQWGNDAAGPGLSSTAAANDGAANSNAKQRSA